jgi:hypothetical protein
VNKYFFIFILLVLSSCKQEPEYQLKEPFGEKTTSSIDEFENDSADYIKIPRKFLDRAKLKERDRKNQSIQKRLREASRFDPKA